MAKVVGIGTGISGKVGNVQYKTVKGMQIIQTKSTPINRQSSSQFVNRTVFGQLNDLFKPLVFSIIKPFWNPSVIGKRSGWSVCLSENQKLQSGSVLDYSKIILTLGTLPSETITFFNYVPVSGTAIITWTSVGSEGSHPGDRLSIFIYDVSTGNWYHPTTRETRGTAPAIVIIPKNLLKSNLRCYIFFRYLDPVSDKLISHSNSTYKSG